MALLDASRPHPVLGKAGDYKSEEFLKSLSVDLKNGVVAVNNIENSINVAQPEKVRDYLLVENAQSASRQFTNLPLGDSEVQLPLQKLLGYTKITLIQLAAQPIVIQGSDALDDFFQEPTGWGTFRVPEGELVGYGPTTLVNISPSASSSWILFRQTEDPGFGFGVDRGHSGKVEVAMGAKLYEIATSSLAEPSTRTWSNLAFAKPALEFAILEALRSGSGEDESGAPWEEGLRIKLGTMGISDADEVKDIRDLQKVAMELLEDEALRPLHEEILEEVGD
jgi:hypothetical protein